MIPERDMSTIPTTTVHLNLTLPQVKKRTEGREEVFDTNKIENALTRAWASVEKEPNKKTIQKIVLDTVDYFSKLEKPFVSVEEIQDFLEIAILRSKNLAVARAYITYRQSRAIKRASRTSKTPDPKAISSYIFAAKYARYLPELQRREIYPEMVSRVENMHLKRYPFLKEEITLAFDAVRRQEVLPSMRAAQFGGEAVEKVHARQYNCSFTHIDRWEAFSEGFYLLLAGCGVGYSIQFDHIEKLSEVGYVNPKKIAHHVVEDTIEGWAEALRYLLLSYQMGHTVEFSYYKIRNEGAPLVTSGGKAPGHLPLKKALEAIREILNGAVGRKLRPVECHRIMCLAADAVLSGGIRRSAMIALFSLEDNEMMQVKTGQWWVSEPYLANANNSVVLKRDTVKKKNFKKIFSMTKQWGEPGFNFTVDPDYGVNPCSEINLYPVLKIDSQEIVEYIREKKGISVSIGESFTGFAFCNLTEINASKLKSLEDFKAAAEAAAIIGTLQAGYTDFPYLGWVTEVLAEREALLGVSMTGIMDSPSIALNPEYQETCAAVVLETNRRIAEKMGINPTARGTTVKPAGTSSLLLGCVGSGIHPHHAKRYIRRITANENESVFQFFKKANPHMCVRKPNGDWVIEFAVEAPPGAIVKKDIGAVEFLEKVRSTQIHWVNPGTGHEKYAPGARHNVSNTVIVKPEEWDKVADYLWEHKNEFTGVSFLPATGDKDYAFAPNEEIVTDTDELRWNSILDSYVPVDYSTMIEDTDNTDLKGEAACAGGACEVK